MGIPAELKEELKIRYSYSVKFEVRRVRDRLFSFIFSAVLNMTERVQKVVVLENLWVFREN